MRDRRKSKGVNVCPELQICDEDYLKDAAAAPGVPTQAVEGEEEGKDGGEDKIVFDDTHRPTNCNTVTGGTSGGNKDQGEDEDDMEGADDAEI
jgi:hypothetical protein